MSATKNDPPSSSISLRRSGEAGAQITEIRAREVLDSRGSPTVEVDVILKSGTMGRAIVPSGASTGTHEALELRDKDTARYRGRGVLQAVANVKTHIAPGLVGSPATEQQSLDQRLRELDGSENKSRLGANALLGVSLAAAHAAAAFLEAPLYAYLHNCYQQSLSRNLTANSAGNPSTQNHGESPTRLPTPMVNIISGGLHGGGNVDLQDYLVIPVGATSYRHALEMVSNVYWTTADILAERGLASQLVADEGGWAPRLESNEAPLKLLVEAIERAGYNPAEEVAIALDVAASHFWRDNAYHLGAEAAGGGIQLSTSGMIDLLEEWVIRYPIISIEDGLSEDDWEGWRELTKRLGTKVQLIGDDLFTTHPVRLQRGIAQATANSVLVKVNQIGTLSETFETLALAHAAGYRAVISARSGETEDATIADLAVGTGAGQIKIGSITRSERLAKYNQLLRIEEALGGENAAPFAGCEPFTQWLTISKEPLL